MTLLPIKLAMRGAMILVSMSLFVIIGLSQRVAAQGFQQICEGVADTGTTCSTTDTAPQTSLNRTIHTALELFSSIVAVVAVVMIIFGGFRYITAGGDSSRINAAQQTIIYAIVGLVLAAAAQIIAVFVIGRV